MERRNRGGNFAIHDSLFDRNAYVHAHDGARADRVLGAQERIGEADSWVACRRFTGHGRPALYAVLGSLLARGCRTDSGCTRMACSQSGTLRSPSNHWCARRRHPVIPSVDPDVLVSVATHGNALGHASESANQRSTRHIGLRRWARHGGLDAGITAVVAGTPSVVRTANR